MDPGALVVANRDERGPRELGPLLALLHDAVMLTDPQRRIVDLNGAFERLLGYARAELLGQSARMLHVDAEHAERFGTRLQALTRAHQTDRFEWLLRHKDGRIVPVDVSLTPLFDGDAPLGTVGVVRDLSRERALIAERDEHAARLAVLAQAGAELNASLETTPTLEALARVCVPTLADACVVFLPAKDGVDRHVVAHAKPEKRALLETLHRDYPPRWNPDHPVRRAVDVGDTTFVALVPPALLTAAAVDARHAELLHAIGLHSVIIVPIRTRDRILGALTLSRTEPSRAAFAESDFVLAREVADRAGAAIQNALSQEALSAALTREQATQDRIALLAQAASSLFSQPTREAVLDGLMGLARRIVDADAYALWRHDRPAGVWRIAASSGLGKPYQQLTLPSRSGEEALLQDVYFVADVVEAPELSAHSALQREEGIRSLAVHPLRFSDGLVGTLAFYYRAPRRRDATELRMGRLLADLAAKALEQVELRARRDEQARQLTLQSQVLESMWEGVSLATEDGTIVYTNPAEDALFGYARGELVGQHVSVQNAYPPDENARILAGVMRELRAKGHWEGEWRNRRKDGSEFTTHARITAIDLDGRRHWVCVQADVTERKRLESELTATRAQLLQGEKLAALGSLVSGVAHELRTPLTFLANSTFLLRQRLARAAEHGLGAREALADAEERFREVDDGVDRINRLVEDLRRYTKARHEVARVAAPLDAMIADVLELFRVTSRARYPLETSLALTRPVTGNKGALQQLALNLLQNAAEASRPGQTLRVVTRQEGDDAILEVHDHGEGIPETVMARMYEPLYTTKPEGTGLGLSIVRRIVQEHDARIECESVVGVGTVFRVRFPT